MIGRENNKKSILAYALALFSFLSFFSLSLKISFSLPRKLCRFSRFCRLENRDEPVGEVFPLLSHPGNENLRDAFRVGVVGNVGAAVEPLAVLADLV
jgi:hypothetical protein